MSIKIGQPLLVLLRKFQTNQQEILSCHSCMLLVWSEVSIRQLALAAVLLQNFPNHSPSSDTSSPKTILKIK